VNGFIEENNMSTTGDPIRLRSMVARGSVLERGLEAAQASGPTDEQLQALERSVLAGLGTATGAAVLIAKAAESHAAEATTGWLSAGATKLVLALVATAAVGGAVAIWHAAGKRAHGNPAIASSARISTPSAEDTLRPELPTPNETAEPASEMPSLAPTPAPAVAAFRKHETPRIGSNKALRGGDEDEEFSLLERANRALAKSPALALSLADEHAKRFPASGMDQEREVIAITALVNLGQRSEAQKRAGRFSHAHAGSVYQGRIDKALTPQP
jgi:hypothetical protein